MASQVSVEAICIVVVGGSVNESPWPSVAVPVPRPLLDLAVGLWSSSARAER